MLYLHSINSYKWTEYNTNPGIYHMMRKNLTTGETIDFGKIPKECLSLLEEKYIDYNDKPTSTLTGFDIADDSEDEEDDEIKTIGSDGENDSSDSSSESRCPLQIALARCSHLPWPDSDGSSWSSNDVCIKPVHSDEEEADADAGAEEARKKKKHKKH